MAKHALLSDSSAAGALRTTALALHTRYMNIVYVSTSCVDSVRCGAGELMMQESRSCRSTACEWHYQAWSST